MEERLFRFNPFDIEHWTVEQVVAQYKEFEQAMPDDDGTTYTLATSIELYANMGYLIGEMIARYYYDTANLEAEIKAGMALQVYKNRDIWVQSHADKPPAMSYFEAEAYAFYKDKLQQLAKMESNLKRFKFAYDSLEAKQNALKKKLESIKYDTFGRT